LDYTHEGCVVLTAWSAVIVSYMVVVSQCGDLPGDNIKRFTLYTHSCMLDTLSTHGYMHSFNKLMEGEGRDAVAMVSNVLQQVQQGKLEAVSQNEGSNQTTYS